jgi:hypothetical protein
MVKNLITSLINKRNDFLLRWENIFKRILSLRSSLFWNVTHLWLAVNYRRFGTECWSNFQGLSNEMRMLVSPRRLCDTWSRDR